MMVVRKKSKSKIGKRKIILIILFIIIILVFVKSCSTNKEVTEENVGYQTYIVKNKDISNYISVSGKVSSDSMINITTTLSSVKVKKLNVEVGDIVKTGDTLVVLDTTDLQKELTELNNVINKTHEQNSKILQRANDNKSKKLADIQSNIDELNNKINNIDILDDCYTVDDYGEFNKDLYNSCINKKIDTYKKEYNETEESLNHAIEDAQEVISEEAYSADVKRQKELKEQINDATIKAPNDGMIISIDVREGSIIAKESIMTIQSADDYKITVNVLESDILKIKEGLKVNLTVVATGDKKYNGVVEKVVNVLTTDSENNSSGYTAIIKILDKDTELLVGMTAKAKIMLEEKDNVKAVPYDAIYEVDGKSVVYSLIDNGKYYVLKEVEVTKGSEGNYYTEIESDDINLGDIILVNNDIFKDGDRIEKSLTVPLQDGE